MKYVNSILIKFKYDIKFLKYNLLLFCIIILVSCNQINEQTSTSVDALASDQVEHVNNSSQFVHPGITISSTILDQISTETDSYRLEGYDQVNDIINNLITYYTTFPSVVYRSDQSFTPTARRFADDPLLAYAHALKWAREGNINDANKAIQILNGWASNFSQIVACDNDDPQTTGCGQGEVVSGESRRLLASWVAPNFAAAAEIIRHHQVNGNGAGWTQNDIDNFEDFLLDLNDNYIDLIVTGVINTPSSGWANNNWGASAAYSQMAIGVLQIMSLYTIKVSMQ